MADYQKKQEAALPFPLPFNFQAEQALLGQIMLKNDIFFDVMPIVTKADFFEPYNGELFLLMRDMIEANRTVLPGTLMHDFSQDRDINGIRASEYLSVLYDQAPPISLAVGFAKTIRDLSIRRTILQKYWEAMQEVSFAPASTSAISIRSKHDAVFEGIFSTVSELGIRHLATAGDAVLERIRIASLKEREIGLRSGLAAFDDLVGPLMPGRLYTLAGGPGSGKSALAQQIGLTVCGQIVDTVNSPEGPVDRLASVLMFEMEMEDEENAERYMAGETGIGADKIERALIDPAEHERLWQVNEGLRKRAFYVDSASYQTVASMKAKALRMQRLQGLDLLIIDHLIYVQGTDPKAMETQLIRSNLQGLKRIAKDLGIPVLLLTQFKGTFNEGEVRDPTPGDLYGGSSVEQESDVIIFVQRDDYLLRRKKPIQDGSDRRAAELSAWNDRLALAEGKAKFILAKRRGGKGHGMRECFFDGPKLKFTDREPMDNRQARRDSAEGFAF